MLCATFNLYRHGPLVSRVRLPVIKCREVGRRLSLADVSARERAFTRDLGEVCITREGLYRLT